MNNTLSSVIIVPNSQKNINLKIIIPLIVIILFIICIGFIIIFHSKKKIKKEKEKSNRQIIELNPKNNINEQSISVLTNISSDSNGNYL